MVRVPSNRQEEYEKFSHKVKQVYDDSKQRYGAVKICHILNSSGIPCSVKRVQRHMANQGLRSVVVKKYNHHANHGTVPNDKANILGRDFEAETIHQKWCTDITYIHVLKEGWTYLACVMDLYSRKIIGYAYGLSMTAELAVEAVKNACLNVKPNAKEVTLTKETNSQAGSISGDLPKSLTSLADSLIAANMGDKDVSAVSPATSVEDKNAMFPVENESWSSKLTADDVESKEVVDNGSSYVITLYIKADEPSTDTAHGNGHNGKVFSVVMPSIVTDNAGGAAKIIKDVKTGHSDGYVKITVDKASGNVTEATYYFVWTLSLTALSANVSIPFGLEKNFTIAW